MRAGVIEITDFQRPGKMSDTKYLRETLIGHWTSCIMATLYVHKDFFCEIKTYCVNKPCIILFHFFFIPSTTQSIIKHTRWRVPKNRE